MIELLHGNCLELMKNIPDKSIDMVLCDLPYGVLKRKWDSVIPFDELWEEYKRICKDNCAIVLFGQGLFTAKLMLSNEKWWRYNLIWKKGNRSAGFLNAKKMPLRNHEDIVIFYKCPPTYNPQMTFTGKTPHKKGKNNINKVAPVNGCYGRFMAQESKMSLFRYPKSVISFERDYKDFLHPAMKPVELLEWLIKTYTNEGDTVLDNAFGSASTGVACIRTQRNFIGMEIDDEFFKIGKLRCEKEEKRMKSKGQQTSMF